MSGATERRPAPEQQTQSEGEGEETGPKESQRNCRDDASRFDQCEEEGSAKQRRGPLEHVDDDDDDDGDDARG